MESSYLNTFMAAALAGGAITILAVLIQLAIKLIRKMLSAAPSTLEDAARLAGKATTKVERSAGSVFKAFKEGRKDE